MPPICHNAEGLGNGVFGSFARSPLNLVKPPKPQKIPKPLSTVAIYIFKTWHSYPHSLATIEIAPKSKRMPLAPLPGRIRAS
jgi:hypothetical protein